MDDLADAGDRGAVYADAGNPVLRAEHDRTRVRLAAVTVVGSVAVGNLARPGGLPTPLRKALFVHGFRSVDRSRRVVRRLDHHRRSVIGGVDRQRRRRRVAVAIGQRVGEDFGRTARRVFIENVAVAAVGIHGQRAELANHDETAAGVVVRMTGNIVAGDAANVGVVRPNRVGARVGRAYGSDYVAG